MLAASTVSWFSLFHLTFITGEGSEFVAPTVYSSELNGLNYINCSASTFVGGGALRGLED